MRNTDIEWEKWGRTNPYFGVSSHVQFLNKNMNSQTREEFFQAGQAVIDEIFAKLPERLGVERPPQTAADFGCGVGRLTIPLARRCKRTYGIDVSESMLLEAEKNYQEQGLTNIEFIKGDDQLSRLGSGLDLAISFYVFQHIPVKRGLLLMEGLARRLAAGGVIHFPAVDSAGRLTKMVNWAQTNIPFVHELVNVIKGRPWSWPQMQANVYPLNSIIGMLARGGCSKLYIEVIKYSHRFSSVVLYFRKE